MKIPSTSDIALHERHWHFFNPAVFSNNLLYPKEHVEKKLLMYACRACGYVESADDLFVYISKVTREVDELSQINADVVDDPTIPTTTEHSCPACGNKDAVFFKDSHDWLMCVTLLPF
ncbi:unnamed protein product [Toxocara canis]|uniref:RPOL9 domain-containing protein n=1 Tax=Toxocara canis TaxID=6265 RepID=A0A183UHH3_TOXCA|nr:unnamed protein product [Toxocara canis]